MNRPSKISGISWWFAACFWTLLLGALPAWTDEAVDSAGSTSAAQSDSSEFLEVPPPPSALAAPLSPTAALAAAVAVTRTAVPEGPAPDGPQPPAVLTALSDNSAIVLSWEPARGSSPISGYQVYRSLTPGTRPAKPVSRKPVLDTGYVDNKDNSFSAPRNRVTYYYRVRSFDTDQRLSDYSGEIAVTPSGPLLPPSAVKAEAEDSRIKLSWSEPLSAGDYGLTGYLLYRSTVSGQFESPLADVSTDESYVDGGVVNGQPYYYVLRTRDIQGSLSEPSREVAATPSRRPAAPVALSARGVGDQLVKLSWKPSTGGGTYPVVGYNVYRSLSGTADLSGPPVNRAELTEPFYEDGPELSTTPPVKGNDYRYVVAAVDERGNLSAPSLESVAGPVESFRNLENLGNISLPGETSIAVNGRKTLSLGYQWYVPLNGGQSVSGPSLASNSHPILDQQLQVRLQGKVTRKIAVDVDYDDKTEDKRRISISYQGDRDEIFQDASFGDVRLDLPRTEFAGYDKNLFGVKVKVRSPNDRLRFQAIGAQTKGITETKRFIGNLVPDTTGNARGRDLQDRNFIAYRYYYLDRDPDLINLNSTSRKSIVPNSVFIFMDRANNADKVRSDVIRSTPSGGAPHTGQYSFILMNPGVDYSVDLNTGLITFYTPVTAAYTILVAYAKQDANGNVETVGYTTGGPSTDPNDVDVNEANLSSHLDGGTGYTDGRTDATHHLIQLNEANYDAHMNFQYYDLANRKIYDPKVDPDFQMVIYDEKNLPIYVPKPGDLASAQYYTIDPELGLLRFTAAFPFQEGNALTGQSFNPGKLDVYNRSPHPNFRIHVEYKYRVSSYNLHFSIIRGSESIVVDGRRLVRDVNYFLDYDTGILVFTNPDIVRADSVVEATYEYSPFGGQFTNNLLGVRGEYDIMDNLSVGTTYLYNGSQAPLQAPEVKATPFSMNLLDADMKSVLPRDLLSRMLSNIPLMPRREFASDVTLTAEVAHSWFNPNTYSQNGENGVAMIDDFESVDNIISTSMEKEGWFVGSKPLQVTFGTRRFSNLTTVTEKGHDTTSTNGSTPNKSILKIEYGYFDSSSDWDAFTFPISHAGESLHDYSNLKLWVKTDNPGTLHVDLGLISNDANGNNNLDTESNLGTLHGGEDVGLLKNAPGPRQYSLPLPGNPPGNFPYYQPKYWGDENNRLDTEDIDGTGQLRSENQNSYYEFTADIGPVSRPDTNNFQAVNFKLTEAVSRGIPQTLNPADPNFFNFVKHARVWFQVKSGSAQTGNIWLESLQVEGNRWQPRVEPGAADSLNNPLSAPDSSKFDVSAVNQQIAPGDGYVPDTSFYNTQQQGSNLSREQSLKITYDLNSADRTAGGRPNFFARRMVSAGVPADYSGYKFLRVNLFKPRPTAHGEVLLIKMGSNDDNYLQYTINLDPVVPYGWQTIQVALDGSDGNLTTVGIAHLRTVNQISLSILNPNPTSVPEVLWINNLRLGEPIQRDGTAVKLNSAFSFADGGLQFHQSYKEVDSNFLQIDQQSDLPKQHSRTLYVGTNSGLIKSAPASLDYTRTETFTEDDKKTDPGFSNAFNYADLKRDRLQANLGLQLVERLGLNVTGYWESARRDYLEGFKRNQRRIYPTKTFDPDNWQNAWQVNPTASYTLPETWWLFLLAGNQVQGSFKYEETSTRYDSASDTSTSFYDQFLGSQTTSWRWNATYKPFSWVGIAPSMAFSQVIARGNLPQPSILTPYYTLGPANYSDNFQRQSDAWNPSVSMDFNQIRGLVTPRLIYNFQNSRNYINNTLSGSGSLEGSTGLKAGEWFGSPEAVPVVQLSHRISVNSLFDANVPDNVADSEYTNSIDKLQRQGFFQGVWWVRTDSLNGLWFDENRNDPHNIEKLALNASKRVDTQVSSRFDTRVGEWPLTWSPRAGYTTDRAMQNRSFATTSYQKSAGTGLDIPNPPIPFSSWLKPPSLRCQYDFGQTERRDNSENLTGQTISHSYRFTLVNKPTDNFTFTLDFYGRNDGNFSFSGVNKTPLNSWQNTYTPALLSTYLLSLTKPIKLWDIWPFYGRELKFSQRLQLDNNFSVEFRNDTSEGNLVLNPVKTDKYQMTNSASYNILTNVTSSLGTTFDYVVHHDSPVIPQDYYAISVQANVAVNF